MARVLKPEGIFWVNHFESRDAINAFHRSIGPPVGDHTLPTDDEARQLLGSIGLRVVTISDTEEAYWLKAIKQ